MKGEMQLPQYYTRASNCRKDARAAEIFSGHRAAWMEAERRLQARTAAAADEAASLRARLVGAEADAAALRAGAERDELLELEREAAERLEREAPAPRPRRTGGGGAAGAQRRRRREVRKEKERADESDGWKKKEKVVVINKLTDGSYFIGNDYWGTAKAKSSMNPQISIGGHQYRYIGGDELGSCWRCS